MNKLYNYSMPNHNHSQQIIYSKLPSIPGKPGSGYTSVHMATPPGDSFTFPGFTEFQISGCGALVSDFSGPFLILLQFVDRKHLRVWTQESSTVSNFVPAYSITPKAIRSWEKDMAEAQIES